MTDEAEKTSTFLVTHADEDSAVLKDVRHGQVHTLSSNPGVEEHDAVEATVAPDPPMNVTWSVVEVEERRELTTERSEEPPTQQEREMAADRPVGEVARTERAGTGEIHVLTVPPGDTEDAVADVLDDEGTLSRAARLGVSRVEVRAEDGVVSVRYMP
ncbi:DUF5812 family protein [Halorussus salilacus]|uniref:DUF5812 family protein n=1 Tax=Halorussus salilacus TaxID=2953750 RepID=UPI00209DEEEB|nr:DUF5812 family protein [Halorussus salilacus]USZ67504.1 DUF5812 family protein [Halorussus salilacus]